jgi:hypothetical protein
MFIVHGGALTTVVDRFGIQQQVVIAASGWMRPRRPTAGHDAAGKLTASLL